MKSLSLFLCLPILALAAGCSTEGENGGNDGQNDTVTAEDGIKIVPEETPATNNSGPAATDGSDGSAGTGSADGSGNTTDPATDRNTSQQ